MDELRYWQLKIHQLLHDPPGKPFHLTRRGEGSKRLWVGHQDLANRLFERFTGVKAGRAERADLAASGADRPIVHAGSSHSPRSAQPPQVLYHEPANSLILHPLAPGAAVLVTHADDTSPWTPAEVKGDDDLQDAVIDALRDVAEPQWKDSASVKAAAIIVWRRMRDELMAFSVEKSGHATRAESHRFGDALWEHMPAETRSPDHSIWDHTRVTAALAFLDAAVDTPGAQDHVVHASKEPWLLQVSLWPIGEFIRQSRKAQDLWLSSFLLADLAWHTMLPIVDAYGPENIISPDLRGNPRVDHWLEGKHAGALPGFVGDPSTFAALLPNTFVAVVPRGGAGHLIAIEDIAAACRNAAEARWQRLAAVVLDWFIRTAREKGTLTPAQEQELRSVWAEQHHSVIQVRWTAVGWRTPERVSRPVAGPGASPDDARADEERAERLRPWVTKDIWEHYEAARRVFARTDLHALQSERGFDYALTHHQLRARHTIRKQTAPAPAVSEQPGEKCTLCGQRTALGDFGEALGDKRAPIESRRQQVRDFWRQAWLDPEESGAERLCAVCAFKRFLIEADGAAKNAAINRTWAGREATANELVEGGKVRVPFPSTSAIASQRFLAAVVTNSTLTQQVQAVVRTHAAAGLDESLFPRSLPRLAAASRSGDDAARRFLRLDPQQTIFPRALDALSARHPERSAQLKRLQSAINDLLEAAGEALESDASRPGTRFAVIQLDGDAMGQLLLGDPARIATTWRDVIHPKHVLRMEKDAAIRAAGWPALLDQKRLMGPSLHAFISRALADFTHRIVPWVVEREHAGRLVYAGGDDVLALAPADEAVKIAARLQALFSAAWVVDTQYDVDTWAWRRPNAEFTFDPKEAQERFVIQPLGDAHVVARGPLLPMLGPGASLSAGITIGHFKTSLRGMLRHATHLLDDVAKDEKGREAVAVAYYTRSGPKYRFAMKWQGEGESSEDRVPADEALARVIEAFGAGRLPSRLPYKLRESADFVRGALAGRASERDLLAGLLRRELDGKKLDPDLERAVLALWRAGLTTGRDDGKGDEGERMVDGLLLARAIAAGEPEDDE